jgi:hypothetical protein
LAQIKDATAPMGHAGGMRDDEIIRKIERFPFPRAPVVGEWRNKGYTLLHAQTGRPIARLRPLGRDELLEIFYWSSRRQRWAPTGPFGRTAAPIDKALRIIASADIFWIGV